MLHPPRSTQSGGHLRRGGTAALDRQTVGHVPLRAPSQGAGPTSVSNLEVRVRVLVQVKWLISHIGLATHAGCRHSLVA